MPTHCCLPCSCSPLESSRRLRLSVSVSLSHSEGLSQRQLDLQLSMDAAAPPVVPPSEPFAAQPGAALPMEQRRPTPARSQPQPRPRPHATENPTISRLYELNERARAAAQQAFDDSPAIAHAATPYALPSSMQSRLNEHPYPAAAPLPTSHSSFALDPNPSFQHYPLPPCDPAG